MCQHNLIVPTYIDSNRKEMLQSYRKVKWCLKSREQMRIIIYLVCYPLSQHVKLYVSLQHLSVMFHCLVLLILLQLFGLL